MHSVFKLFTLSPFVEPQSPFSEIESQTDPCFIPEDANIEKKNIVLNPKKLICQNVYPTSDAVFLCNIYCCSLTAEPHDDLVSILNANAVERRDHFGGAAVRGRNAKHPPRPVVLAVVDQTVEPVQLRPAARVRRRESSVIIK